VIFGSPNNIYTNFGHNALEFCETLGAIFFGAIISAYSGSLLWRGGRFDAMYEAMKKMRSIGSMQIDPSKQICLEMNKLHNITVFSHLFTFFAILPLFLVATPLYCVMKWELIGFK
jgi:hypothetical protein